MSVKIVRDKLPGLLKAFQALTRQEILVGIPDENADRPPENGATAPITNAGIGYVMEFGAPEKNIPARPHLIPGVQAASDKIGKGFGAAARKALKGDLRQIEAAQTQIGDIAANAVKQKITDGPFAPLADSTVRARLNRHKGRQGEAEYLAKRAQGMSPQELSPLGLVKPLIDTGEYRRAITFVIRNRGK